MNKRTVWLILLTLNLISIVCILQIDLGLIPLIKIEFSESRAERINSLISNLSQGVVMSTFFYLILVYLQERTRASTTRKLIQPRIDTIAFMLGQSMAYFVFKYNLKTTGENFRGLTVNDFKVITKLTHEKMNFRYSVTANNMTSTISTGNVTELNHFIHEKEIVIKKIDEVFTLPTVSSEEDKLIEALSQLRDCSFYTGVESFYKFGNNVQIANFEQRVYEYYCCYRNIHKHSQKHKVTLIES
jgi:hypothetical protein